jgi:chromosome segregation ATPase
MKSKAEVETLKAQVEKERDEYSARAGQMLAMKKGQLAALRERIEAAERDCEEFEQESALTISRLNGRVETYAELLKEDPAPPPTAATAKEAAAKKHEAGNPPDDETGK